MDSTEPTISKPSIKKFPSTFSSISGYRYLVSSRAPPAGIAASSHLLSAPSSRVPVTFVPGVQLLAPEDQASGEYIHASEKKEVGVENLTFISDWVALATMHLAHGGESQAKTHNSKIRLANKPNREFIDLFCRLTTASVPSQPPIRENPFSAKTRRFRVPSAEPM